MTEIGKDEVNLRKTGKEQGQEVVTGCVKKEDKERKGSQGKLLPLLAL